MNKIVNIVIVIIDLILAGCLIILLDYYIKLLVAPIESCAFLILIVVILIYEWIRRHKFKENRKWFEKYLYVPSMFFIFMLGMSYIKAIT